ncbi:MAG: SRPBCC family protein [Bacteroidetes bacterium]|nr:SRPBCC family protein [Bacteroidota bacterium]
MKVYSLSQLQKLPVTLDDAWNYFATPLNLPEIIPSYLDFTMLEDHGLEKMYAGQIIQYRLRPILRIPMYWVTEITVVQEKKYFVDEQRYGPYALWHHAHFFKEIPGGVEMRDLVHYKLPLGILGKCMHAIVVRKQLQGIFEYRREVLEKKFGKISR